MVFILPEMCSIEVAKEQVEELCEQCLSSYGAHNKSFLDTFLNTRENKDHYYHKAYILLFLDNLYADLMDLENYFLKINDAAEIISIKMLNYLTDEYLKILKKYILYIKRYDIESKINKISMLLHYINQTSNFQEDGQMLLDELNESYTYLCKKIRWDIKRMKLI